MCVCVCVCVCACVCVLVCVGVWCVGTDIEDLGCSGACERGRAGAVLRESAITLCV